MEQVRGHFDWRKAPHGQPIPLDEFQRLDDLVSRDSDQHGGMAGDAIASAAFDSHLTPYSVQCRLFKITANHGFGSYSASEVYGVDLSSITTGVAYQAPDGAVTLVETLVEAMGFDGVKVDRIVRAWPANWLLADRPVWIFDASAIDGLEDATLNWENVTINLGDDNADFLTINGPGYLLVNASIELCGDLFWCYLKQDWAASPQNNWTPASSKAVYILNASTTVTLTGKAADQIAGATGPQLVGITNINSPVLITQEDGGSLAANRFNLPQGSATATTQMRVGDHGGAIFYYDKELTRHKLLGCGTIMGASGANHGIGLVPDTPAVSGSVKHLREDGVWAAMTARQVNLATSDVFTTIEFDQADGFAVTFPGGNVARVDFVTQLIVKDGVPTTVNNVKEIRFGTGFTVTEPASNVAHVAFSGGGSITIEEVDGSPTGTFTTLRINQAHGLKLVDLGGGIARLDLLTVDTDTINFSQSSAGVTADAVTACSVTINDGDTGTGLTLVNDVDDPGPLFFYSTDNAGVKTWRTLYRSVPASSDASGVAGEMAFDNSYFYLCTADNEWNRVAWGATPWP